MEYQCWTEDYSISWQVSSLLNFIGLNWHQEEFARKARGNCMPFGGIQLNFSGDFFQLPPVSEREGKIRTLYQHTFQAKRWSSCITRTVFLKQVFRQTDQEFVDILNALRVGEVSRRMEK